MRYIFCAQHKKRNLSKIILYNNSYDMEKLHENVWERKFYLSKETQVHNQT